MADDFDENTPQPRGRPQGDPVPTPHVLLPPGENPAATFHDWEKKGRIPPGCVLTEFTGSVTRAGGSGYRVHALASPAHQPLGRVGSAVPVESLAGWRILAVIQTPAPPGLKFYPVLKPRA